MLVEFTVGNYKSFKEPVNFSMVAAPLTAKDKSLDHNNIVRVSNQLSILKCAGIYGANASGKSNLIKAIRFMRNFVLNSSKETQFNDIIPIDPFRLSTETVDKPSFFEIVFITDGHRYRYGFEANTERVINEWLFYVPKTREARLFERRDGKFRIMEDFREGKELHDKTRDNALFLSVVAQFNGATSQLILKWFRDLNVISGLYDTMAQTQTISMLDSGHHKDDILQLIKSLDAGIYDIQINKEPIDDLLPTNVPTTPERIRGAFSTIFEELKKLSKDRPLETIGLQAIHRKFNENGEVASLELFDVENNESDGTKKIIKIAGLLVDTLLKGKTLIVDELEARLHTLITRSIINLFNSSATNSKNAQLIFATHDTNLLSKDIFRRDQIWFAEKDRFGVTHLYSLAEYKVRNDASFESDYIRGRYGAIPFVGEWSDLLAISNGE
jgi:AAA15 family ATPase/GTPase